MRPSSRGSSKAWGAIRAEAALLCGVLAGGPVGAGPALARLVTGETFVHRVRAGESLISLGARFGVEPAVLARANGLRTGTPLSPEQEVAVDGRHLVPATPAAGIVINVPQRLLFLFEDGRLVAHYPIAAGRPGWITPSGHYRIAVKEENPSWEVPASIQAEMRRKGRRVIRRMGPEDDNPLGKHWLGLSRPGYGIHGTTVPTTLYRLVSHGCVRLHPDDVASLFERVEVGTPVEIIYQPVILGRQGDGYLLEVHPDVYRRGLATMATVRAAADGAGISAALDWERVREVLARREGVARDVTGVHGPAIARAAGLGPGPGHMPAVR